jgi:signal transduction histidine kinase
VCGEKIKTAGQFIDFFIHDILDYSVLENQEGNFIKTPECFEIREALTTVLEMVEDKTNMKKIEILTEFKDPTMTTIKTDKKRLTQVILNLVSNALKFTMRDGNIKICISDIKDQHNNVTHVKVTVADTGIGIKNEDKPKLF